MTAEIRDHTQSSTKKNEKHGCSNCAMSTLRLPIGLNPQELERLEQIIEQSHNYQENQILFKQNDTF